MSLQLEAFSMEQHNSAMDDHDNSEDGNRYRSANQCKLHARQASIRWRGGRRWQGRIERRQPRRRIQGRHLFCGRCSSHERHNSPWTIATSDDLRRASTTYFWDQLWHALIPPIETGYRGTARPPITQKASSSLLARAQAVGPPSAAAAAAAAETFPSLSRRLCSASCCGTRRPGTESNVRPTSFSICLRDCEVAPWLLPVM